jgi:hypothetical protein
MLDVPAGATTLPMPEDIDLARLMKTHSLITGFRPLPSRELIMAAARNRAPPEPNDEPVYQGQPVAGPGPVVSIGPSFPGFPFPGAFLGSRDPNHPQRPGRPGRPSSPAAPTVPPYSRPTPVPKPPSTSPVRTIPPRPKATATPPIVR